MHASMSGSRAYIFNSIDELFNWWPRFVRREKKKYKWYELEMVILSLSLFLG
jgi:hypothetical protein